MKKLIAAMLMGIMGIATETNAQGRPNAGQREAMQIAQQSRSHKIVVNPQRIEQAHLDQQRIDQLRVKQMRIKQERVQQHRVKHARIKHQRVKAAREDATDDEQVGNQQPRRRYFHMTRRKRTAGHFNSENLPHGLKQQD